jgi:hypothetical protein
MRISLNSYPIHVQRTEVFNFPPTTENCHVLMSLYFLGHQQQSPMQYLFLPLIPLHAQLHLKIFVQPLEVEMAFGLWQSKWSNYNKINPPLSAVTDQAVTTYMHATIIFAQCLILISYAAIPVTIYTGQWRLIY